MKKVDKRRQAKADMTRALRDSIALGRKFGYNNADKWSPEQVAQHDECVARYKAAQRVLA